MTFFFVNENQYAILTDNHSWYRTDMGKLRANSGPPVLLFRPWNKKECAARSGQNGTYGNLSSHHELSGTGKPFFLYRSRMAVIFMKISLNGAKLKWKTRWKPFILEITFALGLWSPKKKVFTLFSDQRAARGFNSFSKFRPSCEKCAHLWYRNNGKINTTACSIYFVINKAFIEQTFNAATIFEKLKSREKLRWKTSI